MSEKKPHERFDNVVSQIVVFAKAASKDAKVDCLYPESFMIGILTSGPNEVASILLDIGMNLDKCLSIFKKSLLNKRNLNTLKPDFSYEDMMVSKQSKEICKLANKLRVEAIPSDYIGIHHLFLALLRVCPDIKETLNKEGFKLEGFLDGIKKSKEIVAAGDSKRVYDQKGHSALEAFCTDVTQQAKDNKLDPILARDKEIEEAITILCRRSKNNPILLGEPGVGKCLAKGTKILMYDGSFKPVEDINIGELLMGVDSTPRKVLSLGHGFDKMFKVKQVHGENYIVNSNHILSLRRSGEDEILNISVQEYIKQGNAFKHKWKGWKTPINFIKKELPIDPYFLGLWLGDGTARKSQVTNIDREIINYCKGFAKKNNHKMTNYGITMSFVNNDHDEILQIDKNSGKTIKKFPTMRSVHSNIKKQESGYVTSVLNTDLHAYGYSWERNKEKQDSIYSDLKTLGVIKNKHVPDLFKFNDEKSRLSLLAGIIDSDGYLSNNCYDIVQKNKRLSLDIVFVARSLGFNVSLKEKIATMKRKDGSVYKCLVYRMFISGDTDRIPCLIKRKVASKRKQIKNVLNTGIEVEPIGRGEYYGFTIGGDHLFILEDFTVTHNTAIVEGISQRIVGGSIPKQLIGCKVYSLNVSSVVAGTKYRGEFEERINHLVKEIQSSKNCILFIDEIHTLVGAGSASGGSLDASNILKPFLARNDLKCIGATTLEDFKKYFQKDGALERRFQQIMIEEPTKEQMKQILTGVKPKMEQYHNCIIDPTAIDTVISLCSRYLPDRNFPDKAIDAIDVSCAKHAWDTVTKNKSVITSQDVAKVISEQCHVPIEVIMWDDNERIAKINQALSSRVIGQKYAIDTVCRVFKNAYSGIRNPLKPIGSFVFGGKSGTGKTHMAKELAKAVFGKDSSFIKLDMTEFSESHSISKLIGSPPGYVGFQETDLFIDKIKRKPYCIVLLDEFEKAHPSVLKLFLQVMADGEMTDASGNKADFKNVILIMTGNFGMGTGEAKSSLGFTEEVKKDPFKASQNKIISYCKEQYGDEFVNRVDEFVPFMPLSEENLRDIVKMRFDEIQSRLNDRKCKLVFSDNIYALLMKLSKEEHGANATVLNRLVAKKIEPCISDALTSCGNNSIITIDVENDEFVYNKKGAK